jgi:hypothetical protein
MFKLMTLVKTSPNLDAKAFRSYWAEDYLPSILAAPEAAKIQRVVHNYVIPLNIRDGSGFSVGEWAGVGETWFASRGDADKFLASADVRNAAKNHSGAIVQTIDLLCTELPIWDTGEDVSPVKMIVFFQASANMTRAQSQDYWTNKHVDVGRGLNDPTPYAPRYHQNHTVLDFHTADPAFDFVGAPELWFRSKDAAARMFVEAKNMDLLAEDEAKFSDRSKNLGFVVEERPLYEAPRSVT